MIWITGELRDRGTQIARSASNDRVFAVELSTHGILLYGAAAQWSFAVAICSVPATAPHIETRGFRNLTIPSPWKRKPEKGHKKKVIGTVAVLFMINVCSPAGCAVAVRLLSSLSFGFSH